MWGVVKRIIRKLAQWGKGGQYQLLQRRIEKEGWRVSLTFSVSHSLSLSYPHRHIADGTWTLKSFCGKLIRLVDSRSLQLFTMLLILRGNPFRGSDDGDEM